MTEHTHEGAEESRALRIPCPTCNAAPGAPCTPSGSMTAHDPWWVAYRASTPHGSRIFALTGRDAARTDYYGPYATALRAADEAWDEADRLSDLYGPDSPEAAAQRDQAIWLDRQAQTFDEPQREAD